MTLRTPDAFSQVEQIWAGRLAEQDLANFTRLASWHSRMPRDPVRVPEKAQVVWVASDVVETLRARSA